MVDENDAAERGVSRTSEAQAADPSPSLLTLASAPAHNY